MLELVTMINYEAQQIFVRGIDAEHMTNVLNGLRQLADKAAEYDQWKEKEKAKEESAEKEKAKNEDTVEKADDKGNAPSGEIKKQNN